MNTPEFDYPSIPKVIDCTLRDGGYYNNWDFSLELVNLYLESLCDLNVYGVELGFRSLAKDSHRGAFAFTTDLTVESLQLPDKYVYAVMINASEIPEQSKEISIHINKLFSPARNSKIKLVRIAAHYPEITKSLIAMEVLKSLGYLVAINIMGIGITESEKLLETLDLSSLAKDCEVLYLADSNGKLGPTDFSKLLQLFGQGNHIPLGVHTHDNKGLAMSNTLASFATGAEWLDATVTGMGRGPGNTKLESLVLELNPTVRDHPQKLSKLLDVIDAYFEPEKKRLGWGTNVYYHIAAQRDIHPLRIQELIGSPEINPSKLLDFLNPGFDEIPLSISKPNVYQSSEAEKWAISVIPDQEFLIIANNPVLQKNAHAINQFIFQNNPLVVSLNGAGSGLIKKIDLVCASYETRVLDSYKLATTLKVPFLSPYSILDNFSQEPARARQISYPMEISETEFEISPSRIVLNSDEAITYVLSVLISNRVKKIWLAGINGSVENPFVHAKLLSFFSKLDKKYTLSNVTSLTPTSIPIHHVSIHELLDFE